MATRKKKAAPVATTLSQKKQLALKRRLAVYNANRYLRAYVHDKNPLHIAEAWVEFRKSQLSPDPNMLAAVDQLAESLLDRTKARVRPKKFSVRDVKLYRLVRALQGFRIPTEDEFKDDKFESGVYEAVARAHGLSVGALKMIVSRIEVSLRDQFFREPPAFRKR